MALRKDNQEILKVIWEHAHAHCQLPQSLWLYNDAAKKVKKIKTIGEATEVAEANENLHIY